MLTRRQFLAFLAGLLFLPVAPAYADKGDDDDHDDDHDGGGDDDDHDDDHDGDDDNDDDGDKRETRQAKQARDAVKKGKAASLKEVLRLVRNRYPGRVINVDVSGSSASLIYTIKLIDAKNRRMQIRVNANQRRILGAQFI
jgi:uncharacterized membrane protein YkoI